MDPKSAKKFLYITLAIATCVIALSIILVVNKRTKKLTLGTTTPQVISAEEDKKLDEQIQKALDSIDFENFDTDQDGVPDWQEYIYGLNPASASTYGEGTSDKFFIENITTATQKQNSIYSELTPTKTEIFAQDLYKLSKGITSETDIQKVGDQVVDSIKTLPVSTVYTKDDVKYASDYKESYRQYITLIAPSFIKSVLSYKEYEEMIKSGDAEQETIKLRLYNDRLNGFEKTLLQAEPPQQWIDQHLALLNSVSELRNKISNILNDAQDPLVVLASLSSINDSFYAYYNTSINFSKLLQEYLKNQ